MSDAWMIEARDLRMEFQVGGSRFTALDIPYFAVPPGASVAVIGASGSGKTTLLNIVTGILRPTDGHIVVDGVELSALSEAARDRIRAERVGYVFQTFNLLAPLTALENVMLPMIFADRVPRSERHDRATALLARAGLEHRLRHRPRQLSHGERQRVSIARALANRPRLIVADEPTASLEPGSSEAVLSLLVEVCRGEGVTLLVATHDEQVLARVETRYRMAQLNRCVVAEAA